MTDTKKHFRDIVLECRSLAEKCLLVKAAIAEQQKLLKDVAEEEREVVAEVCRVLDLKLDGLSICASSPVPFG